MSLTPREKKITLKNLGGAGNHLILKGTESMLVGLASLSGYKPKTELEPLDDLEADELEALEQQFGLALKEAIGDAAENPFAAYGLMLMLLHYGRIKNAGGFVPKEATPESDALDAPANPDSATDPQEVSQDD